MSLNSTQSLELSVDAYCTMAQVQSYVPAVRILTTSSQPTRVQAINIARDVFQEVNGLLDVLGYVIPVASSNTTAVRIVGRLNALGAAAGIEAAAYSAGNQEDSEHGQMLRQQYKDAWARLEKGSVSIPGAVRKSNYLRRRDERRATAQFDHDSSGNESNPLFSKSLDW